MSTLKQIFDVLKSNTEYDVFFPSQHKGNCISPYYVVKADGATTEVSISSERPLYSILCYVPRNNYTTLEVMEEKAKKAMKQLFPMLMYAGNETTSFYDEDIDGHMISFQYQACRKIIETDYMKIDRKE